MSYKDKHSGYIWEYLPVNSSFRPMCHNNGCVQQHRLVIAESLGRCLKPSEVVHHKNHIRDDNRLENLELMPRRKHFRQTVFGKGYRAGCKASYEEAYNSGYEDGYTDGYKEGYVARADEEE